MKKGFPALAALLLLLLPLCVFAENDFYTEMPYYLRIKQRRVEEKPYEKVYLMRTYPESTNGEVDREISELVDKMAEEDRDLLPNRKMEDTVELDVGASVFRTGTKWMSFVVLSQFQQDYTVTHTRYENRVYDMESGKRLFLTDVFALDSEGWTILAEEARTQLNAYFPSVTASQDRLEALITREKLEQADFALGAASLRLIWKADELYEGRETLMYVQIPYSRLREYMTPEAQEQTDNHRFRMVALTYDDGGAGLYTKRLTYALRENACQATFFVVGNRYMNNRYNHIRQHNMGNSVQSHNWEHEYYDSADAGKVFPMKQKMEEMLGELIGLPPVLMRAPGGHTTVFVNEKVGYPLIQWSLISGDADSNDRPDEEKVARVVSTSIRNGDIVLMHDLRPNVYLYSNTIMENMNKQGILCVTVEEMFMNAGVTLEKNRIYTCLDTAKR